MPDRKLTAAAVFLIAAGIVTSIVSFFAMVMPGVFGLSSGDTTLLAGAYSLVSVVEIGGGIYAYRGRYFYATVAAATFTVFSVMTIPFGIAAVALLVASRGQFDAPNWPYRKRLYSGFKRIAEYIDRVVKI